jgi:hypothetical protein
MTWVQTFTGQAVDLESPDPLSIRRHDIAHALSRIQRFNGHTEREYSVAQHSVLVTRLVVRAMPDAPSMLRLAALLHDAHEAYMGDLVKPLCMLPGFVAPVAQLKARLQRAVHRAFWLPDTLPDEWAALIHQADLVALATEKRDLMAPEPRSWGDLPDGAMLDLPFMLRRGALDCFAAMLAALAQEVRDERQVAS